MLKVGNNAYPLCLLDTNAVSALIKNPRREFRNYLDWANRGTRYFIPSFSLFSVLPCVFLKSFDLLIEDEVNSYPDPSRVDPCLLAFAGPLAEASLAEVLEAHFQSEEGIAAEARWNEARAEVVEGIRSLVANYPPDRKVYSPREIRTFVELAGFSQVAMRHLVFAQRMLTVEIDAFPSVKAATFTVFYKFYVDKTRQPSESDAFDILISAAAPYVEAIVTERHQAEVLRKTMRRDDFIKNLRVMTLRDFRHSAPS
jgi:hypothetical protein